MLSVQLLEKTFPLPYKMMQYSTIFPINIQGAFRQLGLKISGVELAFLSAWRSGYNLSCTLWRTGKIKCKSRRTVLLIFATQVYANLQRWRTPEEHLRRELFTECTLEEHAVAKVISGRQYVNSYSPTFRHCNSRNQVENL